MAIFYSNSSNGFRLKLQVDVLSQDLNLNRSEVRRRLYIENGNMTFSYTTNRWLDFDGVRVYSSSSSLDVMSVNSSVLLHDVIAYVTHDSDGSKSIPLSAYLMTTAVQYYTPQTPLTINVNMSLPTIPRASKITTFNNFLIDANSIPVEIERAVTSFTHAVSLHVLDVDGSWKWIKTNSDVAESTDLSLTATEQNIIYNLIPDALSRKVRVLVRTFNGSNVIGETTKEAVASVPPSVVPAITDLTFYDTTPISRDTIGAYVQRVSQIKTTIVGATGVKGSTIKFYEIIHNGETQKSNPATMTKRLLKSGSLAIIGKAIDSRNRKGQRTEYIDVLPYDYPAITRIDVIRCNSDGSLNPLGTYAKIRVRGNWHTISVGGTEKNSGTLRLRTRITGSSAYSLRETRTVSANFDETFVISGFLVENTYDVQATIEDIITARIGTNIVKVGKAPFVLGRDEAGFGLVPSGSHHVEAGIKGIKSDGPVDIYNSLRVMGIPVLTGDKLMWTGSSLPENVIKNQWGELPITSNVADFYMVRASGTSLALAVVVKTATAGVVLLVKEGATIRMNYNGSTWS